MTQAESAAEQQLVDKGMEIASTAIQADVAHDLSEIHQAMDLMEIKLAQIRHEQNKLALNVQRALEKAGKERAAMHREVSAIAHLLSDMHRRLSLPNGDIGGVNARGNETTAATAPRERHQPEAAPANTPLPPAAETAPAAKTPAPNTATAPRADADRVAEDPDLELDASTLDRLMNTTYFGDISSTGIDVEEIDLRELDIDDPHGLAQASGRPFSQDTDQIFFQSSTTASMKQGWYFSLRGAHPQGPFGDKQTAERVLVETQGKTRRTGQAGA